MSACDECRNDFDAMSRLVESLPDDMKTSDCVSNAKMLLVALAYQKVEKENAKLREELEAVGTAAYLYGRTDLEAENAKLRELVADMWFWHYEGHIDSESQERQMLHIDAVIQRMRELGVEV